jgi:hypothetical protein
VGLGQLPLHKAHALSTDRGKTVAFWNAVSQVTHLMPSLRHDTALVTAMGGRACT